MQIRDNSRGDGWKVTEYAYNAAGKHVWERTVQLASGTDAQEMPLSVV